MRRISTAVKIRGPHRRRWLFEKLVDLRSYSIWLEGLMEVEPLNGHSGANLSRWDIEVHGCPIGWVQEDLFDAKRLAYRFDGRDGDFDFFTGCWRIKPEEYGSLVVFEACWDVGVPIVEDLLGNSIEVQFRRAITRLMEGFRADAEGEPLRNTRHGQREVIGGRAGLAHRQGHALGQLIDISRGGACLDLGEPRLKSGERLILLPGDRRFPRKLEAEVVWHDRRGRLGLSFDDPVGGLLASEG